MPRQAEDRQWGAVPHVLSQGPARIESCHGHEHSTQHACTAEHRDTQPKHPSVPGGVQPASGALGWAHGLGTGAWTWVGAGAPVGRGSCGDFYQGLVGREHGGVGAVPVQGHQRHGAELLLGEVRGGAPAHDHGAQVIVLCTRTGQGGVSCRAALPAHSRPSPAHLGGTASLYPPEP